MDRPFVFVNVAATADGKIDTFERKGAAISSAQDKARVDELRAGADAVLVGGRTLLGELPKLTVKNEALREARVRRGLEPNPMKVGVVTRADLPLDSDFVQAGPARVVIFTTHQTSKSQLDALRNGGVEVFAVDGPRVDLHSMLVRLKSLGVERLMVEGGGTIIFEMLSQRLVDELSMYIAPMIFGGVSAPTLAAGSGLVRGEAIALSLKDVERHEDGGLVLRYSL